MAVVAVTHPPPPVPLFSPGEESSKLLGQRCGGEVEFRQ